MSEDNTFVLVLSAENEYQLKLLNKNLEEISTTLKNIDKTLYQLTYDTINFKR